MQKTQVQQIVQPPPPVPAYRTIEDMPNDMAFQHNAQATNIMLLNNANPKPGMPMDRRLLEKLLEEHQPSAFNLSGVPKHFEGYFLVREVWIGNISPATDKQLLYDAFKIYGEIEGIEMFSSKGFAFIKYRKVVAATRAYERADGTMVDSRPVKVAFADPTRRIDIVGDSLIPENPNFNPIDDDLFKNLFLGYPSGSIIPSESKLREVFSRYGTVKRISIRQGTPSSRPFAFVDFEKGEQASEARKKLYIEDTDGSKRRELGDPAVEISFKNTNNIVSRNGVKNGTRFQDKSSKEEVSDIAKRLLEQPPAFLNLLRFQTMLSMGAPPMGQPGMPMLPMMPQSQLMQYPSMFQNPVPLPTPMLSNPPQQMEKPKPQENTVEETKVSDLLGTVVWSGFMTRSKKYKVGIDATLVEGKEDCFPPTLYHIDISHRVHVKDASKYQQLALLTFEASNGLHDETFAEYVKYFKEKERAGYIGIKNTVLYLCPPIEEVRRIYPRLEDHQLLGIFVDPTKKAEKKKESSKFQELMELLQKPGVTEVLKTMGSRSGANPNDPRRLAHR